LRRLARAFGEFNIPPISEEEVFLCKILSNKRTSSGVPGGGKYVVLFSLDISYSIPKNPPFEEG
jgi:hypothetical protein